MNQQAEDKAFARLTAPEPALATASEGRLIEFAFAMQFVSLKLGSMVATFSEVRISQRHDVPIIHITSMVYGQFSRYRGSSLIPSIFLAAIKLLGSNRRGEAH